MTKTLILSMMHVSINELLSVMLKQDGILTEAGKRFVDLLKDEYALSEMDKLEWYLVEHEIKYERTQEKKPGYGIFDQIRCGGWDAVCHDFSYGGKDGLLETMGMPEDNGDVTGYLTADDVIARLTRR